MMSYCIAALIALVETLSVALLFDGLLDRIENRLLYLSLAFLIGTSDFFLFNFLLQDSIISFVKTLLGILLWSIFAFCGYHGDVLKKFFAVAISYILLFAVDYIAVLLAMLIFHVDRTVFESSVSLYIFTTAMAKILLFVLCYFFFKLTRNHHEHKTIPVIRWFQILIFPVLTIWNLYLVASFSISQNRPSPWLAIDAIVSVLANISLLLLIDKIEQEEITRSDNQILQQELHSNMEHTRSLISAYATQRKMTHDFKNHLYALSNLLSTKDWDRAKEYIDQLIQKDSTAMVVSTNNTVIDALLNSKYGLAHQQNTAMIFKINDLSHIPLSDSDIVTILGNLLDNALHACAKSDGKRIIRLKFENDNRQSILSVQNTSLPVEIKGNRILLRSSTTEGHGFGLNNVYTVLSAYSASCAMSYQDGWFTISILFN